MAKILDNNICDMTIYCDADFQVGITIADESGIAIDLTNYTVKGWYRKHISSSDYVPFTCTITDATAGQFNLSMPKATTSTLVQDGVYDVYIVSPAETRRIMMGKAFISPTVTDVI